MLQARSKICFNDSATARNDPDEIWFCSLLHSRVYWSVHYWTSWPGAKRRDFSQSFIPRRLRKMRKLLPISLNSQMAKTQSIKSHFLWAWRAPKNWLNWVTRLRSDLASLKSRVDLKVETMHWFTKTSFSPTNYLVPTKYLLIC